MPVVYDDQETNTSQNPHSDAIRGLEDSFRAGDAQYPAGHPSAKKEGLLAKEDAVASGGDSLYSPSGSGGSGSKFKIRLTPNQKKGGLTGILIGLILAALTTVSLGPLQFIHFAQMLQGFHFSDQEQEGNSRIKKLLIYARTNDASKTRLGFIANAQANNIDKKFKANGWTVNPGERGVFGGFDHDPAKDGKKATPEEVKKAKELHAKLESEGVKVGPFSEETGKFKVPADGLKYWSNRSLIKTMYSGNRDVGKITAAYEKRILIKRAGITLNPITKLETKAREAGIKKIKEARSRLLTGQPAPDITVEGTKANGTTEDDLRNAAESESGAADANEHVKNAKAGKLKVGALTGAGAVGFLCVVKTIADESSKASQVNRMIPLIQSSAEVLSVGSKVMAGDDVDGAALGVYNESMNSTKKNGGGSWSSASTIQYEEGKTGGGFLPIELDPNGGQNLTSELLSKFWGLDTACKILGSSGVGLIIGAASGQFIGSVVTELASKSQAGQAFFAKIIGLFTTGVVDLSLPKYAGATYGEAANVGARLMANETSASMGGLPLSNAQELALNDNVKQNKLSEDKTKSIAAKYLNPYDYETPVAKTLDNIHSDNISSTVASIPKNMFASLTNLVTKRTLAANDKPPSEAYYGIKKVGFAPGTLDNIENPYTNADEAYDILKGPSGEKYIKLLKSCNKVDASFTSKGLDFASETGSGEAPAIMGTYSDPSIPSECKDGSNDANFLKVRAAAFDTFTMKSLSCVEFNDEESCSDISGTTAPTDSVENSNTAVSSEGWTWPVKAEDVGGSGLGQCWIHYYAPKDGYHAGIDISVSYKPVYAAKDGKVVKKEGGEYNLMVIEHEGSPKLYSVYQHMSAITVSVGDTVKAGQKIGTSGEEGAEGSPHLHFGVTLNKDRPGYYADPWATINPLDVLPNKYSSKLLSVGGGDSCKTADIKNYPKYGFDEYIKQGLYEPYKTL